MTSFSFDSRVWDLGPFRHWFSESVVKEEPMFYNASMEFALEKGGPITRAFVGALPYEWLGPDAVLDSRVHMLMPGWYPCIPGFHHDDVARTRSDGQPDYAEMPYRSEHVMGLVNGEVCPTVFALGRHELPEVPLGKVVYREWHPLVERQLAAGTLERWEAPSGRVIAFDWQSMHAGQRAVANGWRWFCRVSRKTDRTRRITNEVRRQVQVYMEAPNDGW